MITTPPEPASAVGQKCLGDCLVSGRAATSICIVPQAAFSEMVTRLSSSPGAGAVGGLAPPGHEPRLWVIVTHCTWSLSVLPPPREDPLAPAPKVSLPVLSQSQYHSISHLWGGWSEGDCPLMLKLLAFVLWDCNPAWSSDFLMGTATSAYSRVPETLEASWVYLASGMMNSNCIFTTPPTTGLLSPPHLTLSSANMLLLSRVSCLQLAQTQVLCQSLSLAKPQFPF
jgi:hypothetical protein